MVSEFLQSFIVALNGMSSTYRISQLPARAVEIAKRISEDTYNAGSWPERFGMQITKVAIENIELSRPFSSARQPVLFQPNEREGLRGHLRAGWQHGRSAENCARYPGQWSWRRRRYAIRHEHGASHWSTGQPAKSSAPEMSTDEKIETLKKLKELVDMGILTQDEFDLKKKELLGL